MSAPVALDDYHQVKSILFEALFLWVKRSVEVPCCATRFMSCSDVRWKQTSASRIIGGGTTAAVSLAV